MARVLRRVVVDAAPLIALLRDELNVDRILEAIGEAGASVLTVTLAEAADVLERVHGWPSGAVTGAVTGSSALPWPSSRRHLRSRPVPARFVPGTTVVGRTTSPSETASSSPRRPTARRS